MPLARACVRAYVQDVVLKLLRRNQGKAELAVNALIGIQFFGLRRAVKIEQMWS